MADKRWFVVPGAEDQTEPDGSTWTVSLSPTEPGWNTDLGHDGYGLTKALAEELADAANAAWGGAARRGLPKWAQPLYAEQQSSLAPVVLDQDDDGA